MRFWVGFWLAYTLSDVVALTGRQVEPWWLIGDVLALSLFCTLLYIEKRDLKQ